MTAFVYEWVNKINGRKYIGVTNGKRSSYIGSGILFKKAIGKYGIESFERRIIKEFDSEEDAYRFEVEYIEYVNAVDSEEYYNLTSSSYKNHFNGRLSEEVKRKISEARLGKIWTEEQKQRRRDMLATSPHLLSRLSIATKKNYEAGVYDNADHSKSIDRLIAINKSRAGIPLTKEHKTAIAEGMKGNKNHFYGKSHSESSKLKISLSKRGKGTGGENPSAKPTIFRGKEYSCIKDIWKEYFLHVGYARATVLIKRELQNEKEND